MTVIHNQPIDSLVKVGKLERLVDPATLTASQQRLVWEGIKSLDPFLAEMLKADENLAALKQIFNATVQFTVDDFNRYLQAGIKTLEEKNQ